MGFLLRARNVESELPTTNFSVWRWRPIWTYAEIVASVDGLNDRDDFNVDWEAGDGNGGEFVDGNSASIIALALRAHIETGAAQLAKQMHDDAQAALPLEPCKFCDGSGVRTDHIGKTVGMDTQPLDEATAIILGRSHGTCNGCHGEGSTLPQIASYQFDLDDLDRFVSFVERSDGFWIQ